MRDLSNRIDRLTHELRAIQLQLQWTNFQSSTPNEQARTLNQVLSASLVSELKNSLDQLSEFLWCYVESAAANSDPETDFSLQGKRLAQVAEMLRLLRGPAGAAGPSAIAARVNDVVEQHLQVRDAAKPTVLNNPQPLGRSA